MSDKTESGGIVRFRIDPEFKAEVEALAAAKRISVSALTRQLLAEAVEMHRMRMGQRSVSGEGEMEGRAA